MQVRLCVDTHRVKWEQESHLEVTADFRARSLCPCQAFRTTCVLLDGNNWLNKPLTLFVSLPLHPHLPDISFVMSIMSILLELGTGSGMWLVGKWELILACGLQACRSWRSNLRMSQSPYFRASFQHTAKKAGLRFYVVLPRSLHFYLWIKNSCLQRSEVASASLSFPLKDTAY